ncbi:hypothetical protein SF123566_7993 [Shigella flexneri 1235-66]|nr:hypothetical protein SF123566_7993 [Shigella flexneri 1235-66]
MDGIGMGMVALLSHVIGNIMDGDDSVKQNQKNEDQHT